jgi:hypothetical protein
MRLGSIYARQLRRTKPGFTWQTPPGLVLWEVLGMINFTSLLTSNAFKAVFIG